MSELQDKYRMVFNSPVGQEVLADILINKLNLLIFLKNDLADVALNNAAIEILGMMGIVTRDSGVEIIRSLMTINKSKKTEGE